MTLRPRSAPVVEIPAHLGWVFEELDDTGEKNVDALFTVRHPGCRSAALNALAAAGLVVLHGVRSVAVAGRWRYASVTYVGSHFETAQIAPAPFDPRSEHAKRFAWEAQQKAKSLAHYS